MRVWQKKANDRGLSLARQGKISRGATRLFLSARVRSIHFAEPSAIGARRVLVAELADGVSVTSLGSTPRARLLRVERRDRVQRHERNDVDGEGRSGGARSPRVPVRAIVCPALHGCHFGDPHPGAAELRRRSRSKASEAGEDFARSDAALPIGEGAIDPLRRTLDHRREARPRRGASGRRDRHEPRIDASSEVSARRASRQSAASRAERRRRRRAKW